MTKQEILEESKKLKLENAELLRLYTKYEKFLALIAELYEVTREILDKEIDR